MHGGDSETVIKGINIYYDIIYQKSIRVKDPRKYIRENNLTVSKIELFTAQNKDELKSLCENNIVGIQAFSSHISNLEIVPSGISKVQGIKFYLGDAFKDSDIFAIGDEKNDIDMLKLARHSFAVRNACKEVLDIVDTVVDSVDNCGFLQAHSIIKSWYLKLQNT